MGLKSQNSPTNLEKSSDPKDIVLSGLGTTLNSLGTISYERHIYVNTDGTKQLTVTWDKTNGTKNVQVKDLTVKKETTRKKKVLSTVKEVVKSVAEVAGTYHGAYDKAKGK